MTSRTRRLVEEISLSVPVMSGERILSCLTVRFTATAVPLKTALERFLPRLKALRGQDQPFIRRSYRPRRKKVRRNGLLKER